MFKQDTIPIRIIRELEKILEGAAILFYNNTATAAIAAAIKAFAISYTAIALFRVLLIEEIINI